MMIFETVTHIVNKDEFLEKILIYIRLVEVFTERHGFMIQPENIPSDDVIQEMVNIGVIERHDDVSELKAVLKNNYIRFISCVAFYLAHQSSMGTLLDKLSNKKRHELQEKEIKSNKPNFVDFFAG